MNMKVQTHKTLKDYGSTCWLLFHLVGGTAGDLKYFFQLKNSLTSKYYIYQVKATVKILQKCLYLNKLNTAVMLIWSFELIINLDDFSLILFRQMPWY